MDFGLNLIDTAPGQVQLGWERDWFRTSAAAVIAVSTSRGFEPPGPQKRLEAIGTTDGLAAVLQRALAPNASFQPVPVP
jgi:hypothetical protein